MQVRINRTLKTATFFGPGTFDAKDEIKKLGAARWRGDLKSWEVRSFALANDELEGLFPGIKIEEEQNAETTASNEVPVTSYGEQDLPSVGKTPIPSGYSVNELLLKVQAAIREAFPLRVFVYGVLSQVNRAQGGRVFLELTESNNPQERVSCVIWKDEASICKKLNEAGFSLEPQLQVMFEVEVRLSTKDARLSLSVVSIVPEYTKAKLEALREVTNERLKQEGIFNRNKSTKLPFLPKRLGILTSSGGTVIHDFRASLDEAKFGFELFWYPVVVQGVMAKDSVLSGIKRLSAIEPPLDALLIFRGGGSKAELAVFNEYEVARAVCLSPIPVISAIGHQEDQSSVQDVSFLALGVPKDIGHYLAKLVIDFRERMDRAVKLLTTSVVTQVERSLEVLSLYSHNLASYVAQLVRAKAESCYKLVKSLPLAATNSALLQEDKFTETSERIEIFASRGLELYRNKIIHLSRILAESARKILEGFFFKLRSRGQIFIQNIQNTIRQGEYNISGKIRLANDGERVLQQADLRLQSHVLLIESADPKNQLKRGYSIIRKVKGGAFVTARADLEKEERLELEFHDGRVIAEVIEQEIK